MAARDVLIVKIGLGILVALVTLVVVHLITARISDAILESRIGLIDRLGGFAIVLVVFLGYHKFMPEKEQHRFVTEAKSRPLLLSAGKAIEPPLQYFFDRYLNKGSGDPRQG